MKRLAGKNALITGSARGIGRSFAKRYLEEGAQVIIADINITAAQKTASELGAGAIAIELDVTAQHSIDSCVASAIEQLGHIDILINNAAAFY